MTKIFTVALLLPLAACGFDPNGSGSRGFFGLGEGGEIGGDDGDDVGDDGDFDRDDCKIEDDNLGRTDVTIQLANSSARVSSWTEKADSPGEYVGFTLEVIGEDIVFTVKAGGDVFDASGDSWAHPLGDSGSAVSAVSHIDFCDNGVPEGDGGDDGEDGGDDGEDGGDDAECPPDTEGCEPGSTDGGDDGTEGGTGTEDGGEPVEGCTGEFCG